MENINKVYCGVSALLRYGLNAFSNYEVIHDDILYLGTDNRPRGDKAHTRFSKIKYPDKSFLCIRGDWVTRPELTFINLAQKFPLIQLIFVGTSLCGGRSPIMSKGSFKSYCSVIGRIPGKDKAMMAMKYVFENSRSPAEEKLVLNLSLPRKLGGLGLPRPEMNVKIPIPKRLQQLAKKENYFGDLMWFEQKVVAEYDSNENHIDLGPKKLHQDVLRVEIMHRMGLSVATCTSEDVNSRIRLLEFGLRVAKNLNYRHFIRKPQPVLFLDLPSARKKPFVGVASKQY